MTDPLYWSPDDPCEVLEIEMGKLKAERRELSKPSRMADCQYGFRDELALLDSKILNLHLAQQILQQWRPGGALPGPGPDVVTEPGRIRPSGGNE